MVFLVFAIVLYFGLLGIIKSIRKSNLIKKGIIVKREKAFWKKKECFLTASSPETIRNAVEQTDLSDIGISVFRNNNEECRFTFQNGYMISADLKYNGRENGKYLYSFMFTSWNTSFFVVEGQINMNRLLTCIERIIIALDPETVIEKSKKK